MPTHTLELEAKAQHQVAGALVFLSDGHLQAFDIQVHERIGEHSAQNTTVDPARVGLGHGQLDHVTVVIVVDHAGDQLVAIGHANSRARIELRMSFDVKRDPVGDQPVKPDNELDQNGFGTRAGQTAFSAVGLGAAAI